MNSRDRVLCAINHQIPDRIPIDFWASRGFLRKVMAELGLTQTELLEAYDVDVLYIEGPEYIGPPLVNARGEAIDLWGVPRVIAEVTLPGGVEHYEEVGWSPLAEMNLEEVLAYEHWPSVDWFDFSSIAAQCQMVHAQGRAVAFMGDRKNRIAQLKPAMYLRGMEQILLDLALVPEIASVIIGQIRVFYLAYLERILEAANGEIDLLVTGDDFGIQDGVLLSLPMWDRFLQDGFTDYLSLAHSYGVKVMHHTCGSVRALIPRFIDCGLDVLQSLQPEARDMDPAALKAECGDRLAFQGGVSVQRTMPFGTREEIRAQVKTLAETLGRGGGYIFGTSHNLQADVPVENAVTLLEAYREFGGYA